MLYDLHGVKIGQMIDLSHGEEEGDKSQGAGQGGLCPPLTAHWCDGTCGCSCTGQLTQDQERTLGRSLVDGYQLFPLRQVTGECL